MYKIILVYCLVLAVAKGFSEYGEETNNSDEEIAKIKNKILLMKKRIGDLSIYYNKKSEDFKDTLKNLNNLVQELSTIPDKECQNKLKYPLDLTKDCFLPNVPSCKSTMRSCIDEARNQLDDLWNAAYKIRHNLDDYIHQILVETRNCNMDGSISDYRTCVHFEIYRAEAYANHNRLLFDNQMNNATKTSKEFVKQLKRTILAFKSSQSTS